MPFLLHAHRVNAIFVPSLKLFTFAKPLWWSKVSTSVALKLSLMKHVLLLLIGLIFTQLSYSQLSGWNHVEPILVHENTGTTVNNYQLKLTINTATPITSGNMNASGDDIRFTSQCNGGTNFNYWIESGMNTSSTIVWVKIDTLPGGSYRTIYMHWGNASASTASSINGTFFGPHSATDSVSGGASGGVTNSQRGIRFAANEDLLVTAFGKDEPNGTTRYVTLFDVATQAILRQSQVSGPAAQYSYSDLSSPIWLTQGTQYLLEMYQGNTDGYYFGPSTSQIGQHLTYLDMRYCNGCDQNTYPGNYLNNIHYGYPDLWYYSKNNVTPAPTYEFNSYLLAMVDTVNVCQNDSVQLPLQVSGGQEPFTFIWSNTSISDPSLQTPDVYPAFGLMYYVTTTDACGTVKNDSIYVDVKSLPMVDIQVSNPLICNGESTELFGTGDYDYEWNTGENADTIVVSPGISTVYVATATNEFMCTAVDSAEVMVNIPLTATHDITICSNESYQISNHVYTNPGTYIDTLAGVTSCDSIVTTVLTVNQLPETTHNVSICFGTSLQVGNHFYSVEGTYIDTLTGFVSCDSIVTTVLTIQEDIDAEIQQVGTFLVADFGADAYQWIDCNTNLPLNGETESSLAVTQNGSYACIVTIGGCEKQSNCITVDDVSVDESVLSASLFVFPNPAQDVVKLISGLDQEVFLLDASGRVMDNLRLLANQEMNLDLSDFSSGVYFIRHGNYVTRLMLD